MTGTSAKNKTKNKFLMLVKNDFLASARLISLCYVVLGVMMLVGTVALKIVTNGNLSGNEAVKTVSFIEKIMIISEVGTLAIILITVFFVIYDFFKSLYSPQGYLSFTLPVSSNQLLGSKVLVYGGWLVLSYISFFVVSAYWLKLLASEYGEEISVLEMLLSSMGYAVTLENIVAQAAILAIEIAIQNITIVFLIYFAITLSHIRIFQKHSIICSIVIFTIIYLLFFSVANKIAGAINFSIVFVPESNDIRFAFLSAREAFKDNLITKNITSSVVSIIFNVGIFFGTSYIMHKKVNIK